MSQDVQENESPSTRKEANAKLEKRVREVARILGSESSKIGSIKEVSSPSHSMGLTEMKITVVDGDADEWFGLVIEGDPLDSDRRMTIRARYGRELKKELRHGANTPKIGVSVMSRSPEAVARDVDRRLLPEATSTYNKLLVRLSKKKNKERKRVEIAEQINEATDLDLVKSSGGRSYYRGSLFFEREEPDNPHMNKSMVEPELGVALKSHQKLELSIDNLTKEEAIGLINAAEDIVEGPIRQEASYNR